MKTEVINSFNVMADTDKHEMFLYGLMGLDHYAKTTDGQNRGYTAHYKLKHCTFDKTISDKTNTKLCVSSTQLVRDSLRKHNSKPTKISDQIMNKINKPVQIFYASRNSNAVYSIFNLT